MPTSPPIPTYKLYGDTDEWPVSELLHCEAIAERSALHDWTIRPHRHHDLFQMLYCHRGDVGLVLDGTRRPVSGPFLVTVPPLHVHGFEFNHGAQGWVVTLPWFALERFVGPATGLLEQVDRPHILEVEGGGAREPPRALFERLAGEFVGVDPGRLIALEAYLSLIFVWVVREVSSRQGQLTSGAERGAERLRRFQELIETSFRRWTSIQEYAGKLGVTPAQLNGTCRSFAGKSALQIVHERVVIEAKRNLVYTDMTVSEVAYSLGFSDPAYFTRFFKKRAGLSPSGFRDAKRLQRAE